MAAHPQLRAIYLVAHIAIVFGLGRLESVQFDVKALRITRHFSGRAHRRMPSEVAALFVRAAGGGLLRSSDGSHLFLEGPIWPC